MAVLHFGDLAHGEELILVALGVGMAASGTIMLSAIPQAAFSYMSVILIPSAVLCLFFLNQKGYSLLGVLVVSYWCFLAALIAKITREISERKQADTALIESEMRYRALYEDNPSMYFTVDPAGIVLSVNKFGAQQLGCTSAELAGQSLMQLVHEHDRPLAQKQLASIAMNPEMVAKEEVRNVRRDGSIFWVRQAARAVPNREGQMVFLIVCEEITERKQAEVALKTSEARLQEALTAGQVVAFTWNPATGLSQRSENAAQILGLEQQPGAKAGRLDFISRVHPEDRANYAAQARNRTPKSPSYSAHFRFHRPDGQEVWLEETGRAEFDNSGHYVRLKGLTRDITERRRAEERQRSLVSELDHRVKNMLASVSAIAERTREGSSSMDEFLQAFDGRIEAMASAHALLSRGLWQGASLVELVHSELALFVGDGRAIMEGPEVLLSAEATQPMAIVLHELVTNASKYGALTMPNGRISLRWDCPKDGDASEGLTLKWVETGGPPVTVPDELGYGTGAIRNLIPYELGGLVDLAFAVEGVSCSIRLPSNCIRSGRRVGAAFDGAGPRLNRHSA